MSSRQLGSRTLVMFGILLALWTGGVLNGVGRADCNLQCLALKCIKYVGSKNTCLRWVGSGTDNPVNNAAIQVHTNNANAGGNVVNGPVVYMVQLQTVDTCASECNVNQDNNDADTSCVSAKVISTDPEEQQKVCSTS